MCQTPSIHNVEDGRRESDIRPKVHISIPAKKKGLSMDEAISKTKFGLFNFAVIIVGGLMLFAVSMETTGMMYVLPVSECDLNLSTSEKGILAAIPSFGIICSSHLWGYLADSVGRRTVILPTLLVAFVMSFASSLVQDFYIFVILRFLNGFFISGGSATIYAYLGEFHNNNQRGRAIMISSVIFGISCILLPMIAGLVINQDWRFDVPLIGITYTPWRLFLVVCSSPGLLAAAIIAFLPESPKFVLNQGRQADAYQILRKMNRINNGKSSQLEDFIIYEETESIENRKRIESNKASKYPLLTSVWNQTTPLFKAPYLKSTFLICFVQFFSYATGNGFFMFFTEILNRMGNSLDSYNAQGAMMCDVINMKLTQMNGTIEGPIEECVTKLEFDVLEQGISLEILYAVSLLLIGIIVNKVGLFNIMFVSLIVPGVCGFVCMLVDIPIVQIAAFIGHMLCIAPNIINAATVEIYPTSSRAMAVCISLMFGRLGSVVGANTAAVPDWLKKALREKIQKAHIFGRLFRMGPEFKKPYENNLFLFNAIFQFGSFFFYKFFCMFK